jgi:hypothetical protein
VLDALTEQPAEHVARVAPAQSHGWRMYGNFLLGAGHRRIAVAAQPSVYWQSGIRILREHLTLRGGTVRELDGLDPQALCDAVAGSGATALLILTGYPSPAVPLVRYGPGTRVRCLAGRRGGGRPGAHTVLTCAGDRRLAVGLAARPRRRPGPGRPARFRTLL